MIACDVAHWQQDTYDTYVIGKSDIKLWVRPAAATYKRQAFVRYRLMPVYIDKEIADWVDVCWSEHRSESALKIWKRAKDDWGDSGPSKRWVSGRVRDLKARVRELDPEPIARPWGGYWPTDADSVEVLLTLHHEANLLCSSHGVRDFEGITVRMANWACKIRNFFDCSVALDRIMLLQFSIWFAGQERWGWAIRTSCWPVYLYAHGYVRVDGLAWTIFIFAMD